MWIYNKSLRSFLILSIIGLIMLPSGAVESVFDRIRKDLNDLL